MAWWRSKRRQKQINAAVKEKLDAFYSEINAICAPVKKEFMDGHLFGVYICDVGFKYEFRKDDADNRLTLFISLDDTKETILAGIERGEFRDELLILYELSFLPFATPYTMLWKAMDLRLIDCVRIDMSGAFNVFDEEQLESYAYQFYCNPELKRAPLDKNTIEFYEKLRASWQEKKKAAGSII